MTLSSTGCLAPDEVSARKHYLRLAVNAPELATVKDFLCFYAATSCGKMVKKPIANSLNAFAE